MDDNIQSGCLFKQNEHTCKSPSLHSILRVIKVCFFVRFDGLEPKKAKQQQLGRQAGIVQSDFINY